MKLNINLEQCNKLLYAPFINSYDNINISIKQLHNLSGYLEQISKIKKQPSTIINEHMNIIQAVNYDKNEVNNFWFILDKNYTFLDIAVPLNTQLDNIELYQNFSDSEIEIIKSIKDFLN